MSADREIRRAVRDYARACRWFGEVVARALPDAGLGDGDGKRAVAEDIGRGRHSSRGGCGGAAPASRSVPGRGVTTANCMTDGSAVRAAAENGNRRKEDRHE